MSNVSSTGDVTEPPWGATLARLWRDEVTGHLIVSSAGKTYTLVFDLGVIVDATSPLASDAVARIALTSHLIGPAAAPDINRRIAAAPDRDEVEVLGEAASLASDKVASLRARVVTQRAARTFSIDDGRFEVETKLAVPRGASVDVRAVIYEGARRNLSEQRLAAAVRSWGGTIRLDASADLEPFGFGSEEAPVLAALRGGSTLAALEVAHRDVDPRTVHALVYALVTTDVARAEQAATTARIARYSAPPPTRSITQGGDGGYAIPRTQTNPALSRTETRLRDDVLRAPAATRVPTPPQVPATAPRTSPPTTPPQVPATAPRTSPPTTPPQVPATAPRTSTPTTPPDPRAKRPSKLSQPPPTISRTMTSRRARALIETRIALMAQGADHFVLLGVSSDAPVEVVRTAYLSLTRQLHPQALADLGIAVTPDVQRLIAGIHAAYEVVADAGRRATYVRDLTHGPGTGPVPATTRIATPRLEPARSGPGADAFARGEAWLRRDEPGLAIGELQSACQLEPDNLDHRAMLAFARFCATQDKGAAAGEARAVLERMIEQTTTPTFARFLLGRVERMAGRDREALRVFEEVVLEQPHHADAHSEIRAIRARMSAPGKTR